MEGENMKRTMINHPVSTSLLAILLLTISLVGPTHGATPAPAHKITFTESWADKAGKCTYYSDMADPSDPTAAWSCDSPANSDSITISATITGVFDTATLTADTPFTLTLGDFSAPYTLGGDTGDKKYKLGKSTSATIPIPGQNANGDPVVAGKISLKWTAKKLTVTITAKSIDGTTSIHAANYEGAETKKLSTTAAANPETPIAGNITFGDTSVNFDAVDFTGAVTTKDINTKDGAGATLSTISLKGSGLGTIQ